MKEPGQTRVPAAQEADEQAHGHVSRRALLLGALAPWLAAGCISSRERGGVPKAALEHVYFVLDEVSWSELRAAGELERLASVDAGLPAFRRPGPDDVVYVRGSRTYLEVMGPTNRFGVPQGSVGIGLLAERPGDLENIETEASGKTPVRRDQREVTWDVPAPRPWLRTSWFPAFEGELLSLWVSAYDPAFLPWLAPGRSGTRREDFLGLRHAPALPFVDLVGIACSASASAVRTATAVLESAGWNRSDDDVWTDGEVRLAFRPDAPRLRLDLAVRSRVRGWSHGRCSLRPGVRQDRSATLVVDG